MGVFLLFSTLSTTSLFSQNNQNQELTLQQAFDLAIKNNPSLQTERLKVKQSERLEQTAFDLPRTDFGAEFGQINTRALDSRLSASQAFSLPKVYQQRGVLLKAETELQRRQVVLSEAQLKADIALIYYEIQFLKKQKRLFQKQDSVLATNIRNAEIRLKTGESGILEKTTAETQRLTLQHQLKQLETEVDFHQIQLQNRVYTEGGLSSDKNVFFTENQNLKADFSLTNDTVLLKTHPELGVFKQQIEVAQQQILAEQNTLKPSFSIGYALQSIRGTQTFGTRDYNYNSIPQFSTLQFGVQLPLFKKATESRIEAAKIGQTIVENQLVARELARKKMFQELATQFKTAAQDIDFYEKTALPQAKRLIDLANISRRNGEIGYAEWSIATMQSWGIEQAHLEAIRAYNRIVVEIQTLFDFKK